MSATTHDQIHASIKAFNREYQHAVNEMGALGTRLGMWLSGQTDDRVQMLANLNATNYESWRQQGYRLARGEYAQHEDGAQVVLDRWTEFGNEMITALGDIADYQSETTLQRIIADTIVESAEDVGEVAKFGLFNLHWIALAVFVALGAVVTFPYWGPVLLKRGGA